MQTFATRKRQTGVVRFQVPLVDVPEIEVLSRCSIKI